MYTIYVIRSQEGFTYTGYTENLNHRLSQHNGGESFWTKRGSNWCLAYSEKRSTRSEALKREKWLKSGAGRDFIKGKLICQ